MKTLMTAGVVLALLAAIASPASAADDDVVLLSNGGRVRGSVVVEDPAQGVRIRLADGTIRNIAAKDVKKVEYSGAPVAAEAPPIVAPVAPVVAAPQPLQAAAGSIHVETAAPASVTVDGGLVGKAPANVKAAAVGRHLVHVDFDGGGSQQQVILVQGGETANVRLELPPAQQAFADRRGVHFGVEGGLIAPAVLNGVAFGANAAAFLNLAIAPAVDTRFYVSGQGVTGNWGGPGFSVGARFRFNLGSIYTMGLGLEGGLQFYTPGSNETVCFGESCSRPTNSQAAFGFLGPTCSLFGFRFGEHRQFELTLTQAFLFFPSSSSPLEFSQSLNFGALFGAGS